MCEVHLPVAEYIGRLLAEGDVANQVALWWHEAEAAVRARRLPRARRFLRWILACCPEDEEAWLWLARLASSQQARLAYLRQAYAFQPMSARVQVALRQARSQQLESGVGDLKPGRSLLRCLRDERYLASGGIPAQNPSRGQLRMSPSPGSPPGTSLSVSFPPRPG